MRKFLTIFLFISICVLSVSSITFAIFMGTIEGGYYHLNTINFVFRSDKLTKEQSNEYTLGWNGKEDFTFDFKIMAYDSLVTTDIPVEYLVATNLASEQELPNTISLTVDGTSGVIPQNSRQENTHTVTLHNSGATPLRDLYFDIEITAKTTNTVKSELSLVYHVKAPGLVEAYVQDWDNSDYAYVSIKTNESSTGYICYEYTWDSSKVIPTLGRIGSKARLTDNNSMVVTLENNGYYVIELYKYDSNQNYFQDASIGSSAYQAEGYLVTFAKETEDTRIIGMGIPTAFAPGQTYAGMPTAKREGYEFKGWRTEEGDIVTSESVCNLTKNETFYPEFVPEVKIIIDGTTTSIGGFGTIKDLIPSNLTTDNTIGFYANEACTIPLDLSEPVTPGTKVYTKKATLDKLTITSDGIVSAKNSNISGKVVIPQTINGKPVTTINENAFTNCSNITEIVLPEGITTIDQHAFNNCNKLETITISSTVTHIGIASFQNNTNLKHIELYADHLQTLEGYLFDGSTSLEYNQFDNAYYLGNENNPYLLCVKAINTSITSNTIHSDCKSIGHSAFLNCKSLTSSANIPEGVTILAPRAFQNCSKMTELSLPSTLLTIGRDCFYSCSGLKSELNLPSSLNVLGSYAFYNCTNLKGQITIPSGITEIEEYTFNLCKNITSVKFHAMITAIGDFAFSECSALSGTLTLPVNVKTIGAKAFYYCTKLNGTLNIPEGVTDIGDNAFYRGSFSSITLPSTLTKINASSFAKTTITSLTLYSTIETIESNAFLDCTSLKTINFKGTQAEWNAKSWKDLFSGKTILYV